MPFVLDCSMTMAWLFTDEGSDRASALRDSLLRDHAVVPSLWPMEVANVLLAATRRGRIQHSEWKTLIGYIGVLPITIDSETGERVFTATLPLADHYRLSVYDAVYLELALRKRLPLATLDQKLRHACQAAGGETI